MLLVVGESLPVGIVLADEAGVERSPTQTPVIEMSAPEIGALVDGQFAGLSPGRSTMYVQVDDLRTAVQVHVYKPLDRCCRLARAVNSESLCDPNAGPIACPMRVPGGECDLLDGGGDTPLQAAMDALESRNCVAEFDCSPEPVPNEPASCSSSYVEGERQWRCVVLSTEFPGGLASQVCHDVGDGPQWLTYNLDPADCCACDGAVVDSGSGPPLACQFPVTTSGQ